MNFFFSINPGSFFLRMVGVCLATFCKIGYILLWICKYLYKIQITNTSSLLCPKINMLILIVMHYYNKRQDFQDVFKMLDQEESWKEN